MKKRFAKWDRTTWCVLGIFAVLLVFGLCTFKSYGVSWDELAQRKHTLVTYKYLVPSVSNIVTRSVDFTQIPDLQGYGGGNVYGVLLQLPTVLVEHLFGFQLDYPQILKMRHLYVFAWFFLASVAFYHSCKRIFKDRRYAVGGLLMFILAPRILADGFYNVKDSLSLSCATLAIYFSLLFLDKKSWKTFIPCVLTCAMATTARIVNAVIPAGVVIVVFLQMCLSGKAKKAILFAVGSIVGLLGLYIAITPTLWENTLENLVHIVNTMSNYTTWSGYMLFMGEVIWGDQLPWYYLFVWITVTTPIVYIVYMCWGTLISCYEVGKGLITRKMTEYNWKQVFIGCVVVAPFLYVILFRPVLYNGWRHFYFVYGQLVIVALFGIRQLMALDKKWLKRGVWLSMAATFCITAYWIVRNTPYGYLYFNKVFENYAVENFEKDYWHSTQFQGLDYICRTDDRDHIRVIMGIEMPLYMLPEESRSRIEWVGDNEKADYVIRRYVTSPATERLMDYYLYDDVFEVKAGKIIAQTTFKESYDLSSHGTIAWKQDKLLSTVNGDSWTVTHEDGSVYLDAQLNWEIPLCRVFLKAEEGVDPQNIRVWISEDGNQWTDLQSAEHEVEWEGEKNLTFDTTWAKYIRLVISEENWSEEGRLEYKLMQENGFDVVNNTRAEIRDLSATMMYASGWEAFDNDYSTCWSTGDAQEEGDFIQIEYKESHILCGFDLDVEMAPWDVPQNLQAFVSQDGVAWSQVALTQTEDGRYEFDAVPGRFLRLEIGELTEEAASNWSVYEMEVYQIVE